LNPGRSRGIALDPVLAVGERAPLVHDVEDQLREGEGDHRKVDPAATDRQEADGRREGRGGERPGGRGDGERQLEGACQERGGVAPDPPERGVAERQEAGEAEEEVDRHREEAPEQDLEREHRVDEPRQNEKRGHAGEDDGAPEERPPVRPHRSTRRVLPAG